MKQRNHRNMTPLEVLLITVLIIIGFVVWFAPIDEAHASDEWQWFTRLPVDEQQLLCATDTECEWAFGIPVGAEGPPRLVGRGCEGAGGFIYAYEEDHFPRCKSIIPVQF